MANKRTRLDVLRRLFENNSYDNQVDILNDLKNEGFMVAQPTLSRDMRQLKVSRIYNKEYMRRETRQILSHRCLFVSY